MHGGDDPTISGDFAMADDAELEPRQRIAERWEIQALIGAGGMGNVYRAYDHELGDDVALKVLRRTVAPDALERFRAEVKLARRVTHVNVARTHDIGKHGDTMFLTMELVDGEPLTTRMSRGPVPWRDAMQIARSICEGVGAAHGAGVVHRDLKPDNVMLGRDGRVVVTDFGIAATYALARGTETVEVTGTPQWMAPEQLTGHADARSDVYAIGEILWNMITGEHPWIVDGKLEVMSRMGADARSIPRRGVPDTVAIVIDQCLRKDPARRYSDARQLAVALKGAESAAETASSSIRPISAPVASRDVHVGVEPIKNLGERADDYVAAGLAEDLIDMLGRARGIRVRTITGGATDDLDVIVGGSLRRGGDSVRINVRATGARDGFQIWSARFDRPLDQILKVSDEVARDVATALSTTAARGGMGRDVATDQVVVELYLKARQLVEVTWLDDPRPLTLYQAALERDPDSPVVLSAYATLLARRLNAADVDLTVADEALSLACRAIQRGPGLGEPWMALGVVFYNQSKHLPCARALRVAVERAPSVAEVLDAAGRLLLEVDPAVYEPLALLERARWANPRLPNNLVDLVRANALLGDWDAVDRLLASPGTESVGAQTIARARMAIWRGGELPRFPSEIPGFGRFRWVLDIVSEAQHGGLTAEAAARWATRVHAMAPQSRPRRYFGQLGAEMAMVFGNREFAWRMIDEAVTHGLMDVTWLDRCPLLAGIRDEPRFAETRALVGARAKEVLAVWRGPAAEPDVEAWIAEAAT